MNKKSNRAKVLVVDDEPTNLSILGEILSADYDVSATNNAIECLEHLKKKNRPDIILLDVMMEDMNGFELCEKIHEIEHTEDVPVIFVTSLDDNINEEVGFNSGAVDYIYKPIYPEIVKARVKVHLERKLYQHCLSMLIGEVDSETVIEETNKIAKVLSKK